MFFSILVWIWIFLFCGLLIRFPRLGGLFARLVIGSAPSFPGGHLLIIWGRDVPMCSIDPLSCTDRCHAFEKWFIDHNTICSLQELQMESHRLMLSCLLFYDPRQMSRTTLGGLEIVTLSCRGPVVLPFLSLSNQHTLEFTLVCFRADAFPSHVLQRHRGILMIETQDNRHT